MLSEDRYRNLLLLCVVLGVLVGLFSAGFALAWAALLDLVWGGLEAPVHRLWVTPLAGLLVGLTLHFLGNPGSMATIIRHFHASGRLPHRDNLPILPASLIGLVGGQSAGPEGALTQICGSMGSWLGDRFDTPRFTRILTLAGMGAGFGAFLRAPVGGAVLWLEMLHRRGLEYYEAVVPVILTSFVGYLTMAGVMGIHLIPPWHIVPYTSDALLDLAYAAGVALVCAGVAHGYALLFRGTGRALSLFAMPIYARTTLAGAILGVLGFAYPLSYFYGGYAMNTVLGEDLPLAVLLGTLAAKLLAASVTIKGHFQGGLIIPHLFAGALIGKAASMLIPGLHPTLGALAGMAAFNAAATQTPLASALIPLALTGFSQPIPVFLASLVGYLAGYHVSLIEHKQPRTERRDFHLPEQRGDTV